MGRCDSFLLDEIPEVDTQIYHFAGLTYGDFHGELFRAMKPKGKVAVDVQCLLRHIEPDKTMNFYDWEDKLEYMPDIDFLKTDAAEAEILTGYSDRVEAAKALYAMGAKEIMISHNTEILIYDGKEIFTCPIKARKPFRPDGPGGHLLFRIHHRTAQGKHSRCPAVCHGPGLSENGDAGTLPGETPGRMCWPISGNSIRA
jgi:hypothetical protein